MCVCARRFVQTVDVNATKRAFVVVGDSNVRPVIERRLPLAVNPLPAGQRVAKRDDELLFLQCDGKGLFLENDVAEWRRLLRLDPHFKRRLVRNAGVWQSCHVRTILKQQRAIRFARCACVSVRACMCGRPRNSARFFFFKTKKKAHLSTLISFISFRVHVPQLSVLSLTVCVSTFKTWAEKNNRDAHRKRTKTTKKKITFY